MNDANNQDDLKILDLDFADLYQFQHIQFALADLISKDDPNKPIIAAHLYGRNNLSSTSDLQKGLISEEDHKTLNQELKKTQVDQNIKDKFVTLSKEAIANEFDAMFALIDARKRPVAYLRWMPKDNELFLSGRDNAKGHYVCLYFFHDHNNEKSILIANPNGYEIAEESEAHVITSYLKKNPAVKIYQSQDYTQFGQSACGPGALVLLRMLYNMSEQELKGILEKGEKKTLGGDNQLNFTTIKLGDDALQKEIGKIPQKNTQAEKDVDQKLRHVDYATAKVCKENNNTITNNDCAAVALADIPFDQELVKDLPKNQATLLSKSLLSGKQLLTPEQISQAQQKREEILSIEEKKNVELNISNEHKSSKSELHNSAQDHKPAGKCGLLMGLMVASTFATIFFAFFLSRSDTDLGKKICGAGLAVSILVFVSTIAYLCLRKTLDSKLCVNLTNPKIETTPILQQLPQK